MRICLILMWIGTLRNWANGLESALDLSNWMQVKKDALWNESLLDLTIPGTHDSGAYNLTKSMLPGAEPAFLEELIALSEKLGLPTWLVVNAWSLAQPENFYDQMVGGVRYIDLRCGWMKAWQNWVTFHGAAGQGIPKLLRDIKNFLNDHPFEIVLIEASHLDGSPTDTEITWLLNNFTSIFENDLFPRQSQIPTYGDMISANKRVFLSLDNHMIKDFPQIWNGTVFENTYADSPIVDTMIAFNNDQIDKFNSGGTNPNALFKISWTLTPNGETVTESVVPGKPKTLMELATLANVEMDEWLETQVSAGLQVGNVFIYDNYPEAMTAITNLINAIY